MNDVMLKDRVVTVLTPESMKNLACVGYKPNKMKQRKSPQDELKRWGTVSGCEGRHCVPNI